MNTVQGSDDLVGAWRLVSWRTRGADGQITYPMDTDPSGYVLYTADGRFSVTISRRGRAGFAAGDLLGGTTEEKARAVEGFVAYAGRYSFHGDRVIHHVELSLFPNWVGSDQERWVELAGRRLILSASPLLLGASGRCPAWSGNGSIHPQYKTDRCQAGSTDHDAWPRRHDPRIRARPRAPDALMVWCSFTDRRTAGQEVIQDPAEGGNRDREMRLLGQ
jgi:Lipocalin-like domain